MQRTTASWIRLGVLALILVVTLFTSFGTVAAGQVGVVTRLGKVTGTKSPGLYMKLPWGIDSVHKIPVSTLTINYDKAGDNGDTKNSADNLFAASSDLQDVAIGVVVNYHIDSSHVADVYTQFKDADNYQNNVIEPMVREVVKSISSQYTADALVTQRAAFADKVTQSLSDRMLAKGSVLENAQITNFEFSDSFAKAIEAKVTAVQNAEAEKNKLEQVKYEAQQRVEQANGEAQAIKIQAQAIESQGGQKYTQLKWIEKWDGHLPNTSLGASTPIIDLR